MTFSILYVEEHNVSAFIRMEIELQVTQWLIKYRERQRVKCFNESSTM